MRTVCIVQARTSSSRLPRKVLLDIEHQPMLAWCVKRLLRSTRLDEVMIATSDAQEDEAIVALASTLGVRCWRGPLLDVLARYQGAAVEAKADVVVRVTSDCPFIDPVLVDQSIAYFTTHDLDYLGFEGYPRGLDHETFSSAALSRAFHDASLDYERVHVTPHLYRNPSKFRVASLPPATDLSHYRWTVDTPEDLAFARAVARKLGPGDGFDWQEILNLLLREPQLAEMNAMVRQKAVEEC